MTEPPDPIWDQPLSADEFARLERLGVAALDGDEGAEMRAFHEWFCRRYPTPLARLRYVRRQVASIVATQEKVARFRR